MNNFSSPANLQLDPRDEKIRIPFESEHIQIFSHEQN